jgi:hypothetical protein
MGYTLHYQFRIPKGIPIARIEAAYQRAIVECSKLAVAWNADCKRHGADWMRLSGYTAHCKPGRYRGVELNGKGENAHESFNLREHFRQNTEEYDGAAFCKTDRKPYDTVIKACLAVLKHRLGNAIEVSSDGKVASDWDNAVTFARRILQVAILNPLDTAQAYPALRSRKAEEKRRIKAYAKVAKADHAEYAKQVKASAKRKARKAA